VRSTYTAGRTVRAEDGVLKQEARWLGRKLAEVDDRRLFPLINVGSSTGRFREVEQPWIDEQVFAPLRARSGRVLHFDVKAAEGVDIVGDLTDAETWGRLRAIGARSVFCSNLLEHVTNREETCDRLFELVPPGGLLILSVPRAFPYHPDPIDTLFRPDVSQLAGLFPRGRTVDGAVVKCGTVLGLLDRNVVRLSRKVVRTAFSPRAAGGGGPGLVRWLNPWLIKPFEVTCLVLERPA
jgi:hypothetical protein